MKSSPLSILTILVFILALAVGCKSKKDATKPNVLNSLAFEELIEKVHQNHPDFETFSARISAQANFANSEYVFNGSLRIVKDSAIFISATVSMLGEVARVVITPDSLKLLNRMESWYFAGDINYLNRLLGANVDYQMLQALLKGNDLMHFSHKNPQVSTDSDNYVISSNERTPLTNPFAASLQNRMWINWKTYRISQNIILDVARNKMVRASYKSHNLIDGRQVPVELELLFSDPSNNIFVSLQLSRVELNTPVEINFSVPARFRPIDVE